MKRNLACFSGCFETT